MRQVEYADVPTICDQLLEEIETTGVTIEIVKNGIPMARLGPVDEAVRMLWENRRHP
jgi:antitoxin (DNA-binding transcriptional repressor) of toxin-antitoxin stability system